MNFLLKIFPCIPRISKLIFNPYIFIFQVILINQELVERGFAEWLYSEPVTEEEVQVVEEEAVEYPQVEETESLAVAV